MMHKRFLMTMAACALLATTRAGAQNPGLKSADVKPFIGTWAITMTNPAGARETVKIWDNDGVAAATVQMNNFPPTEITGMLKDGDMLVLTAMRLENGQPIRVVMSVILEGDMMKLAQLLERSETIKRGSGKRE